MIKVQIPANEKGAEELLHLHSNVKRDWDDEVVEDQKCQEVWDELQDLMKGERNAIRMRHKRRARHTKYDDGSSEWQKLHTGPLISAMCHLTWKIQKCSWRCCNAHCNSQIITVFEEIAYLMFVINYTFAAQLGRFCHIVQSPLSLFMQLIFSGRIHLPNTHWRHTQTVSASDDPSKLKWSG